MRRWLAIALLAVPGVAAAQVEPDDAQEIVETLLGFQPSRHASDLEAMHGWSDLYARQREAAAAGDEAALRVWLLIGEVALRRADAGTTEAFAGDLMGLWRERPDAVLSALAENGWLVPGVCYQLGAWFEHEGRGGEGREAFLSAERPRIEAGLHPEHARACLAQVETPTRPE